MQEKTKDFFWPSYVDLLTVLFAVVMVLFVLSFKLWRDQSKLVQTLQIQKTRDSVSARQYDRIQQIDKQIQALERGHTFTYDSVYKRFLVKEFIGKEIFNTRSDVIKDVYRHTALQAGREVSGLIASFGNNPDVSFVVLIEGNTALTEDGALQGTVDGNYTLSYRRSLALQHLWTDSSILFRKNTEVIIAGSGVYGIGRDPVEENNKRFLIQVIPKIKK